jgi:CHAT domain-containing protein
MAQYLKAQHIDTVQFADPPFVFLNACQVGSAKEVLGDYGGMAWSFLAAGAAGVVAPLWNVNDHVASWVAKRFYEDVYGIEPIPIAEALRRVRAHYTRDAVIDGEPGLERWVIHPTLIAYQLFGHPGLQLVRPSGDANTGDDA